MKKSKLSEKDAEFIKAIATLVIASVFAKVLMDVYKAVEDNTNAQHRAKTKSLPGV